MRRQRKGETVVVQHRVKTLKRKTGGRRAAKTDNQFETWVWVSARAVIFYMYIESISCLVVGPNPRILRF